MPARTHIPFRQTYVWLIWSAPVWLVRRLTRRVDCTVGVYELLAHAGERRIHREHTATPEDAVATADRLVETLEDGTFPSGA